MIDVDGAYGEGGGQIVRMAVALAACTNIPVRVTNIRAGRSKPGLRPQHIAAIEAVRSLCNGSVTGLREHSTAIEFVPNKVTGGNFQFDVGTAGSITLVFQACILPALFADRPTTITVTGGTDVNWSPPWDYFSQVFLPLIRRMGVSIESTLHQRGYYPQGGGKATISVAPGSNLHPPTYVGAAMTPEVTGTIHLAHLPSHVASRARQAAQKILAPAELTGNITIDRADARSPGMGIVLWSNASRILGADVLGEKGVPAERVGSTAARQLVQDMVAGADLDVHAVDHLLPYMALTPQPVSFSCRNVSRHATTELWLLEKFMGTTHETQRGTVLTDLTVLPTRTLK